MLADLAVGIVRRLANWSRSRRAREPPPSASEVQAVERITSAHNPTIAEIRSLHRRKARREQGAFLLEGVRLVREALAARADVRTVVLCDEMLGEAASDISREIDKAAPNARC